jgi:hypothetical protein
MFLFVSLLITMIIFLTVSLYIIKVLIIDFLDIRADKLKFYFILINFNYLCYYLTSFLCIIFTIHNRHFINFIVTNNHLNYLNYFHLSLIKFNYGCLIHFCISHYIILITLINFIYVHFFILFMVLNIIITDHQ